MSIDNDFYWLAEAGKGEQLGADVHGVDLQSSVPLTDIVNILLAAKHITATLLINEQGEYLGHLGDLGKYIDTHGRGTRNVLELAHSDLVPVLRAALAEARRTAGTMSRGGSVLMNQPYRDVTISVDTVLHIGSDLTLVRFTEECAKQPSPKDSRANSTEYAFMPSTQPWGILRRLTVRQRAVFDLVLEGSSSKVIAARLNISPRTVNNHRAAIMKRTGARCVAELVRLALAAGWRSEL